MCLGCTCHRLCPARPCPTPFPPPWCPSSHFGANGHSSSALGTRMHCNCSRPLLDALECVEQPTVLVPADELLGILQRNIHVHSQMIVPPRQTPVLKASVKKYRCCSNVPAFVKYASTRFRLVAHSASKLPLGAFCIKAQTCGSLNSLKFVAKHLVVAKSRSQKQWMTRRRSILQGF